MEDDGPTRDDLKEFHKNLFGPPLREVVHFISQPWLDVAESLRKRELTGDHEGSRTYVQRLYIAKMFAGMRNSKLYVLATDQDIANHPAEFAAYQEEVKRGNQQSFQRWPVEGRIEGQPEPDHLHGLQGPGERTAHPIGAAFAGNRQVGGSVERIPIGSVFASRAAAFS